MRYYLIAGEASGDLHGSNLMKSLLKEDPSAEFRFWGGDLMRSVYDGLVKHYSETAVMGVVEVLSMLGKIRENNFIFIYILVYKKLLDIWLFLVQFVILY